MDDMSKAFDTLRDMLSTEEGQKTISSLMDSFGGSGTNENNNNESGYEDTNTDYDMPLPSNAGLTDALSSLSQYGEIFSSVKKSGNAPRMQLLGALKPYLSGRRQQKFGTIMNLMKYSDVPAALIQKMKNR